MGVEAQRPWRKELVGQGDWDLVVGRRRLRLEYLGWRRRLGFGGWAEKLGLG